MAGVRVRAVVWDGAAEAVALRVGSGSEWLALVGPGGICSGLSLEHHGSMLVVTRPASSSPMCVEAVSLLLAAVPEALKVEERPFRRAQLADATWMVQGGWDGEALRRHMTPIWDQGIMGEGQIVTLGDSGLDVLHCAFVDSRESVAYGPGNSNLKHRKVVAYNDEFTRDRLDQAGHGSRCGGIVAGTPETADSGSATANANRGIARNAKLAVYDMGNDPSLNLDGPEDLATTMFPWAFNLVGSSLFSGSFGATAQGGYSFDSQAVDRYSWANQYWVAFFGAGNSGEDRSRGGRFNIDAPASSKSGIAVGSSMSTHSGDPNNLSSFSSSGPTTDGRIKPDLVSVGQTIISPDVRAGSCAYSPQQGTSFSCPLVAGATALIRQYFVDGFYPKGAKSPEASINPMAATLRAVLLLSTAPLKGIVTISGQEFSNFGVRGLPNVYQGFGALQLGAALHFDKTPSSPNLYVYQSREGLVNGDKYVFCVRVASPAVSRPLRVVLAWQDFPADLNALMHLVNDLDLEVVDSTGETVYGNSNLRRGGARVSNPGFAGSPDASAGADRLNTAETVLIPSDALVPGATYTVVVRATHVPKGPQPFAVAATFDGTAEVGAGFGCTARATLCPGSCSGSGTCVRGTCECLPGTGGDDCSRRAWNATATAQTITVPDSYWVHYKLPSHRPDKELIVTVELSHNGVSFRSGAMVGFSGPGEALPDHSSPALLPLREGKELYSRNAGDLYLGIFTGCCNELGVTVSVKADYTSAPAASMSALPSSGRTSTIPIPSVPTDKVDVVKGSPLLPYILVGVGAAALSLALAGLCLAGWIFYKRKKMARESGVVGDLDSIVVSSGASMPQAGAYGNVDNDEIVEEGKRKRKAWKGKKAKPVEVHIDDDYGEDRSEDDDHVSEVTPEERHDAPDAGGKGKDEDKDDNGHAEQKQEHPQSPDLELEKDGSEV